MIPGVNPRQLKQAMKQMGISQEEINAVSMTIETPDKKYVFQNPSIQKVLMQGQESFQVSGEYTLVEAAADVVISDDDVATVVEQAGVSKDEAMKALDDADGDIAQAIINLEK